MSFRNRCVIAGANGIITLSIPLREGRNQKTIMKDIRSANTDWQSQHWKTLESCYNRSPWFEFFKDELSALYSNHYNFLLDWNLACFEWSLQKLGLQMKISLTEKFEKETAKGIADYRTMITPKNYKDFDTIRYRQVFEERIGFQINLSILDMLFCEGKNAKVLLGK